jgi:hypothetical protein
MACTAAVLYAADSVLRKATRNVLATAQAARDASDAIVLAAEYIAKSVGNIAVIAPSAMVRANNVVTVTATHALVPGSRIQVTGTSTADTVRTRFDGPFYVDTVTGTTEFTYRQFGPDESTTGGAIRAGNSTAILTSAATAHAAIVTATDFPVAITTTSIDYNKVDLTGCSVEPLMLPRRVLYDDDDYARLDTVSQLQLRRVMFLQQLATKTGVYYDALRRSDYWLIFKVCRAHITDVRRIGLSQTRIGQYDDLANEALSQDGTDYQTAISNFSMSGSVVTLAGEDVPNPLALPILTALSNFEALRDTYRDSLTTAMPGPLFARVTAPDVLPRDD